ncbi:endomucin isoform X2 [Sphaerodactylus townsendi]|uniref:endomucin isoform X2 n=1 Tax=Sphaerodactylus townsendi TaxID=933632 RepID=UPI002026C460|nr:endomucin isoform X2 [Sphaerodactylus townsendi]
MKCFRMAFFSLAVFSLWSSTVQDSANMTTTTSTVKASSGSSLRTSSLSATTATSLRSAPTPSPNGNKASQATSSSLQVLPATNNSTSTCPTSNITEDVRRNETHRESISQNTTQRSGFVDTDQAPDTPSYTSIILPVIIALIVITLSVCILVGLYRICWKTTPERQENETEHTSLDKENVKLISVKTTSPESGEHSSQGTNKTRQPDNSSSHLGNK